MSFMAKTAWNDSQTTGNDVLNDIRRAKQTIENDVGYVPPNPFLKYFAEELKNRLASFQQNTLKVSDSWRHNCRLIAKAYIKAGQKFIQFIEVTKKLTNNIKENIS